MHSARLAQFVLTLSPSSLAWSLALRRWGVAEIVDQLARRRTQLTPAPNKQQLQSSRARSPRALRYALAMDPQVTDRCIVTHNFMVLPMKYNKSHRAPRMKGSCVEQVKVEASNPER
ncbi:hypothetical protein NA56DRAFT_106362 [Hyaloscypha hepaticicola]|uniref:Secreted protein n=1 Tax=Hyaloscypha hepaticicola TaxID=2082293 RepID=A0A2J6Q6P1_9HELO|nr:hypothetical protein NA56DRAFT_106362 [Hyaloscypha hepaticicola]